MSGVDAARRKRAGGDSLSGGGDSRRGHSASWSQEIARTRAFAAISLWLRKFFTLKYELSHVFFPTERRVGLPSTVLRKQNVPVRPATALLAAYRGAKHVCFRFSDSAHQSRPGRFLGSIRRAAFTPAHSSFKIYPGWFATWFAKMVRIFPGSSQQGRTAGSFALRCRDGRLDQALA